MDKAFWQQIVSNDYAISPGYTVDTLTPELMRYLGSPDPVLRDEFGYMVFVHWLDRGLYEPDALRGLVPRLVQNMTMGLGERETDTVFLRSFSVLWLAAITYYDNHRHAFLTETQVRTLLDRALDYFAAEQDLRGYIVGKGWAHAIAHTADLLDEFVQNRFLVAADIERILDAISSRVQTPAAYPFLHNEDDRLTVAVLSALKRELLSTQVVTGWLQHLAGITERNPWHQIVDNPMAYNAFFNVRNMLRSLYIRLALADDLPRAVRDLLPSALATLKPFMR
ncbi:MAG: DUF2785 domain-containing protein [Chloroflexi bacterium]|nr:DUF2785 domain-containing protein [Chloroflexota bacterium]